VEWSSVYSPKEGYTPTEAGELYFPYVSGALLTGLCGFSSSLAAYLGVSLA